MHRIYRRGQIEYYYEKRVDEELWEEHWSSYNLENELKKENQFFKHTLYRYNSRDEKIIEAGCGSCSFLYTMHYNGYKSVGVDFARKTLCSVKNIASELNLCVGNLERLPFEDASFSGYWSIGVIEHFRDSYEKVLVECNRVLKNGGIAYISFPYMNLLRKIKGALGVYDNKLSNKMEFYQYALNYKAVIDKWENHGFSLTNKCYMFPHKKFNFIKNKLIKFILDPFHHHSIMLIFRKES